MKRLALPLLALLLTGCEVGPNYRRPQFELTGQFRAQAQAEAASFGLPVARSSF